MSNQKNEFENEDPLDRVSGTISGSSDFIPESTMIPESGMVMLPDESGDGDGPAVVGDDDGDQPIAESLFTEAPELPKNAKDGAGLKNNLPMIIFGVIAAGAIGFVGMKFMGKDGQNQTAPQAVAAVAPVKKETPKPVEKKIEKPVEIDLSTPVAAPVTNPVQPAEEVDLYKSLPVSSTPATPATPATPVAPMEAVKLGGASEAPPAKATLPTALGMANKDEPLKCEPVKAVLPTCGATEPKPAAKKSVAKKVVVAKRVKKAPVPLPSIVGYEVHMSANDLAWVKLPTGEMRIVTKGDLIEGLGTVKEIDHRKGLIRVGRVTLR